MNINDYKNDALNTLRTIKPEWVETNEVNSAIDVIALTLALIKPSIEEAEVEALNNGYTNTADFQHLIRGQGSVNNVVYLGAMNTRQLIIVNSNGNGILEKDFKVSDNAGKIYKTTEDIELLQGNNWIVFVADETGPISSQIGTITNILTPNSLVLSVYNPTLPSFVGREAESEQSYKIRVQLAQQGQSLASNIIENKLINQAGCTRAKVYYNSTPNAVEYIRPYSYSVVVVGGDEQSIFEIIAQYRIVQEQSYFEETKHTGLVKIDSINFNNKKQSSTIFIGYCDAVNIPYFVKIYTRNFPSSKIDDLKNYIIKYLNDNYIENFQQPIQESIFVTATNLFINEQQLSQVVVINSELSYDNVDYYNEIEPKSIKDILTLIQDNIILVNN